MRTRGRGLALRWRAVALVGALAAPWLAAADDLYAFVDRDGVIHYTNVPHDARYRLLEGGAKDPQHPGAGRRTGGAAGRPAQRARRSAFDEHIDAAARKYGLAPPLLKAVMAVESNFDPGAISLKGATGLMQLMPGTARDMYVRDVLDPAQNIDGGARYLRQLQDLFEGDLERTLAAYNAGPDRVRRSGGAVPPIPETQAYVRKVLRLYHAYLARR